ncbi:MAG: phage holin family protein [Gemmatimonadales bacterium]|nr:phage holin family protein [Gemmatimonadales bacterium]
MRRALLRFLVSTLALAIAVWIVPGLHYRGTLAGFLPVAAVFGLVNGLLRPILMILTCPLVLVTLGLFTLVINALLLMATGALSARLGLGLVVHSFHAAFLGGMVVGLASMALTLALREHTDGDRTRD